MAKDLYIYRTKLILPTAPVTIPLSGTWENSADPMIFAVDRAPDSRVGLNGEFTLWASIAAGAGSVKAEARCSCNDSSETIKKKTISPVISASMVAGETLVSFTIPLCTQMTILLTATAVAAVVVNELYVMSR